MTATLPAKGATRRGAAGAGSAAKRPRGTVRSALTAGPRTAKDWLDRPMTSWHLITSTFVLLLGFGLLMVLSASATASFHLNDGRPFATFENQALFAVLGLFGYVFAARVSIPVLRTFAFPLVAVSLLLLAAVLASHKINGARSWISIAGLQFQPSEVAKLALLLWMGHTLAARRSALRSLRALLIPVLPVFVIMVALIMLEPDLGTTVSLGLVFIAVMWFGGAPWWIFAVLVTGAGGLLVYLASSAGYRLARVAAWLHPATAPAKDVYQIHQSLYGLGHGGIFGAGLGQAVSKTGWLPNADSDFIFAVIGEELGLIGAGLVLILFAMLTYTGLRIARRNVDPFVKIVAASGTVWLVGQAVINIGYVVGLLPVTGIPLPMISRGGTSLVITMVVFGLLANFARREPQAAAALLSQGPGPVARFLGLPGGPPKPPKKRKAARPPRLRVDAVSPGGSPAGGRSSSAGPLRSGRGSGLASGRGSGTAEGSRPAGGSARPLARSPQPARTGNAARSDRRARREDKSTPAPRVRREGSRAPELRRSGDERARGLDATDWQGRSFVDPVTGRTSPPEPPRSRPSRSGSAGDRRDRPTDNGRGRPGRP